MFRTCSAFALLALTGSLAFADPGPTLLTVFPPGVKAGEAVEVTVTGTGFDGEEKLLFTNPKLKAELVPGSAPPPPKNPQPGQRPATTVKFKVAAPSDSGSGTFDVRLVCKGGLTNPRAFAVGTMNELNEKEPNNDVPEAQKLTVDTTVNGTIGTNTDVDYFVVHARAKQNLVVHCLSTAIDSRLQAELTVIAPDGKPIAANRGYRDGDAVLDFLPPVDGDYLIRLSQFAYTTGGPDHFYRLTVTTGEWVDAIYPALLPGVKNHTAYSRSSKKDESDDHRFMRPDGRPLGVSSLALRFLNSTGTSDTDRTKLRVKRTLLPSAGMLDVYDPSPEVPDGNLLLRSNDSVLDNQTNHTAEHAQPVVPPCDIAGRIEKKGARHWYGFTAKKGDVWTLEVFADRIGSPVDAFFQLTDEKGKVIVEQDDGPDSLSPNQFYTKSDDPGRYRFSVPADGTYKVMVSTREAAVQFGVRDQYVLRIAKEKPDFRLAVMPVGTHYLDAGTMPKGGAALFNVYVWRFDGFDGPIALTAENLPQGVTCLPQVIGAGQSRGALVLSAAADAADWAGFVGIKGTATGDGAKLESAARPFSVVWPIPGVNAGQPAPNGPMITRMDRGDGLAVAVRGEAPFTLTTVEKQPIKLAAGGKLEVTVKLKRSATFKDSVQLYSATPGFGPRQQGNQPPAPLGGIPPDKDEVKLTVDLPQNVLSGPHTLVLRGIAGAAVPKGGNNQQRVPVSYPTAPIAIDLEGKGVPKKR